jgi:hypothetical protein
MSRCCCAISGKHANIKPIGNKRMHFTILALLFIIARRRLLRQIGYS